MRRATIRTRGPFSSLAQRMTLSQRHPATPPPLRRGLPQPDRATILTAASGAEHRQTVAHSVSCGYASTRTPAPAGATESPSHWPPHRISSRSTYPPPFTHEGQQHHETLPSHSNSYSPPSAPTLLPPSSSPEPGRTSAPLLLCGSPPAPRDLTSELEPSLPTSPPLPSPGRILTMHPFGKDSGRRCPHRPGKSFGTATRTSPPRCMRGQCPSPHLET